MNCVLFAKMNQVFSLKKQQNIFKILENRKNTGKIGEFCQSGKDGLAVFRIAFRSKTRNVKNCLKYNMRVKPVSAPW